MIVKCVSKQIQKGFRCEFIEENDNLYIAWTQTVNMVNDIVVDQVDPLIYKLMPGENKFQSNISQNKAHNNMYLFNNTADAFSVHKTQQSKNAKALNVNYALIFYNIQHLLSTL